MKCRLVGNTAIMMFHNTRSIICCGGTRDGILIDHIFSQFYPSIVVAVA